MQTLRVRLLGELQLEGCDMGLLSRRQLRTLLKILALNHDRPVGVERLVDCLWGDTPPARPVDQVSVLVSRLRQVVGPDRIVRNDAGFTLQVDWLDLDAIRGYSAESDRRLTAGAVGAARAAASAGLSLIRGPLLADEPDPWWAQAERSAAALLVARLHHTAARAAMAADDYESAIDLAHQVLLHDPFDEVALQLSMEALARSGRSASALAAYGATRTRLAEELGVSPAAATEALHTAILLGDLGATPSAQAPEFESRPPLAGRANALGALDALLERGAETEAPVGLVEGEAGIGKSRLMEFWCEGLIDRGISTLCVGCDELGRDLPFQPLLDAVAQLTRIEPEHVLGPDLPVLGPLLGLHTEPVATAQLAALTDPGAGQALVLAAIFNVFRRHAADEPWVLVIDDVHQADAATARWLAQAPRRLADSQITIVVAGRGEEGVTLPGTPCVTLGPLDLSAVSEIVGAERATALHIRSGGHPLFLVELASADDPNALPANILTAVQDRCQRSGPAAATIRAAAVIGPDVDLDLLVAATALEPVALLDHLEEGVRRRLLTEDGARFMFAHSLVREALASSVGASRTAYIHREVARALGLRLHLDPLAVAHHARLGGETAQASAMLVAAARIAVTRFDQGEALGLLNEAVELDDTAAARLERARVASMAALHQQASDDIRVAQSLGAGADALEVAAWSAHFERRFDDALALADRAAAETDRADLRTNCLALGGWVSLAAGDLIGSDDRLQGALVDAPAGDVQLGSSWMAWLRMNQGHAAESLRLVKRGDGGGLAAYRFPNAYGLMSAAMALAMLGRADEALAVVEELSADVARMGAVRWVPRPLNLRAWIVRNLGALNEADDLNQAAIEAALPLQLAEPHANALLDLASGRLLAGDPEGARQFLNEAEQFSDVPHAFRWRHQLRARLLRARLDLVSEDPTAALHAAQSLMRDAASLGVPRYEVQAQIVAAHSAHALGHEVDLAEIGDVLDRLKELAGLESWWITKETANRFGVDQWHGLAGRRLTELHGRAGTYADSLARLVRRFDI